jgi:hypothetical protein
MLPQRVYQEDTTQQLNFPLPIATTQEHQPPSRVRLQVQMPVLRQGTTLGCCFDSRSPTLPMDCHIAGRLGLQPRQQGVLEPRPHFGLPQSVEALDGRLEARLSGRDKDRYDSQACIRICLVDMTAALRCDFPPFSPGIERLNKLGSPPESPPSEERPQLSQIGRPDPAKPHLIPQPARPSHHCCFLVVFSIR